MPSFPPMPNLTDLLDEVGALAPLPHVANRAVQVADDERFSAYDLAAVIATDTAMTAKILRRTNSAYYGFPRRISTVHDAVVLIGFRAVRATAIAAGVADLIPLPWQWSLQQRPVLGPQRHRRPRRGDLRQGDRPRSRG